MKIESDTIRIPELSRFIGKNVEIIFLDDSSRNDTPNNVHSLRTLKGTISFDEEAVATLREKSTL